MCTERNILFYIAGLFVMAFGIVLIKKAGGGVSPVSAIPSVLADLLPLSFGNTTILFQVVCLAGIAATAMGITLVVRANLMLPSPDALIRAVSDRYSQPLSRIKMEGDGIYVAIALALELIFFHHPESV